jgi:segregation and condensation protein B
MAETDPMVEKLKPLVGAILFGTRHPQSVVQIRHALVEAAEVRGGEARAFETVSERDIKEALRQLREDCEKQGLGFHLVEVAHGFKFQSDPAYGLWLRHLLDEHRRNRLSHAALETLAIIAYRQPVMRSEIEGVRGVNVDHIIALLLEMQLIRIAGRSDLPGRPFLYGTTGYFLEHFGLKDLRDLPAVDELSRRDVEHRKAALHVAPAAPPPAEPEEDAPAGVAEEGAQEPSP